MNWGSLIAGAVVGLFCISPDAGSYPQWESEVNAMLQHYQPMFNKQGYMLSMQHNRYVHTYAGKLLDSHNIPDNCPECTCQVCQYQYLSGVDQKNV